MKRLAAAAAAGAAALCIAAPGLAQGVPATDIYLVPLGATLAVGVPVNITNRPGYNNQPSFTPDGRAILYTSIREDAQSDIYRYDLDAKSTARVTATPESEYSPTVMPGGRRFSVIRVEKDSAQRLWSFALDGADPKLVIESLKPVGYHAWLDANSVVMFVLGRPNALVKGDLRSGKMDTLARGIGRSLAKIPGGFSFTQDVDSATHLRGMDPSTGRTWEVATLPRRVQDVVWLPNGTLVIGSESKLFARTKGATDWTQIADLSSAGLRSITRLAVSPDGKFLAIVAVPAR